MSRRYAQVPHQRPTAREQEWKREQKQPAGDERVEQRGKAAESGASERGKQARVGRGRWRTHREERQPTASGAATASRKPSGRTAVASVTKSSTIAAAAAAFAAPATPFSLRHRPRWSAL